MDLIQLHPPSKLSGTFKVPVSKSEANRLLTLQCLHPWLNIRMPGALPDDVEILKQALFSEQNKVDVGHAGTAMRFATAALAIGPSQYNLTGSTRMQQRPISPLVDALRTLGANIRYAGATGYPPLQISGKALRGGRVPIEANVSSQFISALMLIGTALPEGLHIELVGEVVSRGYLTLTAETIRRIGGSVVLKDTEILVKPIEKPLPSSVSILGDWSAAVFAYMWTALVPDASIQIEGLSPISHQPDKQVMSVFQHLGVRSGWDGERLVLTHTGARVTTFELDCTMVPDMAQALAVSMAALGIPGRLSGLHTLRIKETDRMAALVSELSVFGIVVQVEGDSLILDGSPVSPPTRPIETYDDHRMAMAFSGMAAMFPVSIANPDVVSKSFPDFWTQLANISKG
jgi:3-phosphoshikimate 1-carboxyvinyltransferase